jgi:hypothetical protein
MYPDYDVLGSAHGIGHVTNVSNIFASTSSRLIGNAGVHHIPEDCSTWYFKGSFILEE